MGAPAPKSKNTHPIDELIEVMRALRNPDGGCPWDLEQNFKSIAPYTLEEAYEVADAIDRDDMTALREELGDLLLQSVYHAQMAAEAGLFDINDVIRDISAKMVSRHPHVFGETKAASAADVDKIWDERKKNEKESESALDGVAQALPALLRAQKLQKRAAKVGFEWPGLEGALNKLEEELAEMREAIKSGTEDEKKDELGDILFVVANIARMMGINPEEALRQCNNKFERRFRGVEKSYRDEGKDILNAALDDMTVRWNAQKKKEK